jgi:heme/copper-type cytochrome/quinol oxidase subunit 2
MPANYTELKRFLESDPTCPMCETSVSAMNITLSSVPEEEFKALTALMKDSSADDEKEDDDEEEEGL